MSHSETRAREIADRIDIRGLIDNYCNAISKSDWEAVANCYIENASFYESPPIELTMTGRDQIVDQTKSALGALKSIVIMANSCCINLEDNAAYVETIAQELGITKDGDEFSIIGRYEDHVVRDGSIWLIAKREFHALQWKLPSHFLRSVGLS